MYKLTKLDTSSVQKYIYKYKTKHANITTENYKFKWETLYLNDCID